MFWSSQRWHSSLTNSSLTNSSLTNSSLTNKNCSDLERVQKGAVRVIMEKNYQTYKSWLKILKQDTLEKRREKLCLQFPLKLIGVLAPWTARPSARPPHTCLKNQLQRTPKNSYANLWRQCFCSPLHQSHSLSITPGNICNQQLTLLFITFYTVLHHFTGILAACTGFIQTG